MKYLLLILICSGIFFSATAQVGASEINQYTQKISEQPDSIKWYVNRGDAYMMVGDVAAAKADYQQVIKMYNANPLGKPAGYVSLAYFKLSEILLAEKEYVGALKNIQEALTLKPGEKTYLVQEARTLAATPGKEKEAMLHYDNLVVAYPTDEVILLEYGKWVEPKDPPKAVVLYGKVLRTNVLNTEALMALALYYQKATGKISDNNLANTYRNKAISYLQLLYKVDPQNVKARELLVNLLESTGRSSEASQYKAGE